MNKINTQSSPAAFVVGSVYDSQDTHWKCINKTPTGRLTFVVVRPAPWKVKMYGEAADNTGQKISGVTPHPNNAKGANGCESVFSVHGSISACDLVAA